MTAEPVGWSVSSPPRRADIEAIAADDTISERQRQVLLEIYAAFQSENAAAAAAAEPDPAEDGTTDPAPKPTR